MYPGTGWFGMLALAMVLQLSSDRVTVSSAEPDSVYTKLVRIVLSVT
jgi:hypothetical protein